VFCLGLAAFVLPLHARAAEPAPAVRVLDVPFVSQSEALCGGAAAAMVLRFWGARGVDAESFSHLVEERAGGIRTTALLRELDTRGWTAVAVPGSEDRIADEINRNGRPVLALIEDRPGAYHYIVVVGAPERGLIFHDPARSSYRVMPRHEFVERWRATDRWMAIVTPRAERTPSPVPVSTVTTAASAAGSPCDALVAEGVRQAQAGNFSGAEKTLASALGCPGGAAYRELAGLRVLQKRWGDAASLADTATRADTADDHSWRLLGTARFLQNDRAAALAAFNQAGEPSLDTVQVTGLRRTRAVVVEDAIDVDRGEMVTPAALGRARRRVDDVPAVRSGTVEYSPVSGGRAEVRATIDERRLFPSSLTDWAAIAGRGIFSRHIRASFGSFTGSGERLDLDYRFRPGRPLVGATFSAPAPWGGVWSAHAEWERQPFDSPLVETSERTTGRLAWTDWVTENFQVSVRGGADRWQDVGARGTVGAMAYAATLDDRISLRFDVDTWLGDTRFSAAKTIAKYRSSNRQQGLVFVSSAGAGVASDQLPLEAWFAGDSGNARPGPVPLRAHGLVNEHRFFRTQQMGRTIVHASGEGQYWFAVRKPDANAKPAAGLGALSQGLNMGIAVFLDTARVSRRLYPDDRGDVDLGVGLRVGLPGGRGSIRLDYGRGLLHEANRLSFGFEL
jgi:hypothetical protein